jgi:hypothetical protein
MYRLLPSLVMCFIDVGSSWNIEQDIESCRKGPVVQPLKCKSQNATGSSVGSTFAFFLEVTGVTSGVQAQAAALGCGRGAKRIVKALELEFRLLKWCEDIFFHVERTDACQFPNNG